MATQILKKLTPTHFTTTTTAAAMLRCKTTSAQYVSSRARDPTFEKLMDHYKNLLKVIAVQDLILSNPLPSTSTTTTAAQSLPVDFLNRLSQKLHLNRGATAFLRKFPHIFHIFYHPTKFQPFCTLTPAAIQLSIEESRAITDTLPVAIDRLVRLLCMSHTKTLPLRAIFKVYKELGLPDDFESSVISNNPHLFALDKGNEINTHVLKLVKNVEKDSLVAAVENWRMIECCNKDSDVNSTEMRYSFKHIYPPGMRLTKNFKAKVKEWQSLPYIGPYEMAVKRKTKAGVKEMEKRAVGIVHEFLSLTVEKIVEVEKISHFRKWYGIELNIRDLFLDHPGMFYLSTKGKKHTVFLREAYERRRLIEPNPVYEARMKLFDLVLLGRRGLKKDHANTSGVYETESENENENESENESESESESESEEYELEEAVNDGESSDFRLRGTGVNDIS